MPEKEPDPSFVSPQSLTLSREELNSIFPDSFSCFSSVFLPERVLLGEKLELQRKCMNEVREAKLDKGLDGKRHGKE